MLDSNKSECKPQVLLSRLPMDRRSEPNHQTPLQDTEIASLQFERDTYRVKYGNSRAEVASLEARLDEANDQIRDLKRALQHALEAGQTDSEQAKHQVALTLSSPAAIVKTGHAQSAHHGDNSDSEVEYIGSSTTLKTPVTSKARDSTKTTPIKSATDTPQSSSTSFKMSKTRLRNFTASILEQGDDTITVPCVCPASTRNSIQLDRGPNEASEIRNFDPSDDGHATKRRRVTPVSHSKVPRNNDSLACLNSGITRNLEESALTLVNSNLLVLAVPESDVMINGNAFSQKTPQEVSANSSTILDTPSSASQSSQRQTAKIEPQTDAEASILPPSPVSHYLNACKPLDISPPPSTLCVSRKFLRVTYGGSDQQFLQYIDPQRNPSAAQKRRIVFPRSDMNPAMPTVPGEPGLIYASRHEILDNPPWTLFARDQTAGKKAVWRYLGEYESELCGKMSPELFNSQESSVKRTWAEAIIGSRLWDVYVAMRARIALRKDGVPLSDEAVTAQIIDIRNNIGLPVTMEDVISALQSGEEAIDIIRMQCVFYDHIFMNDMTTKFQLGDSPHGVSRSQAKAVRTRGVANRRKSGKRAANGMQTRRRAAEDPQRARPTIRSPEPEADSDVSMSEFHNDDSSYIDEDGSPDDIEFH